MTEAEPPRYPENRPRAAAIRSRFMLEVASELVGDRAWPHQQVRVDMRAPGADQWATSLFGSDGIDGVDAVLTGESQFAIVNPATVVRSMLAHRGGRGDELAAITTVPSYDQLGLAVHGDLGLRSLDELVSAAPKLTISLRGGRPNHCVHVVIDDVLGSVGTSLVDLKARGAEVRYDDGFPHGAVRSEVMRDGVANAVFDEGVYNWVELANGAGLRFLGLPADALARLAERGYRAGILRRQRYATLGSDVETVDFSGFLVFTRSDVPDSTVRGFCEALVAARDRIPWQGGPSLPLNEMCRDTVDAPLPIPFHPAAEATWRRHGFL